MKKLVISLVLGASLAIVPSAFALKAMTSDSMKDTTGQAGVSIAVDDIVIYQSAGTTRYIDSDSGGALVIAENGGTFTTLRAVLDDTNRGGFLAADYELEMSNAGLTNVGMMPDGVTQMAHAGYDATVLANGFIIRPLSIDVSSSLQNLSAGYQFNTANTAIGIVGVSIGLPTLEIAKVATSKTYSAEAIAPHAGNVNHGAEYITIEKDDTITTILGGTLEIAPH